MSDARFGNGCVYRLLPWLCLVAVIGCDSGPSGDDALDFEEEIADHEASSELEIAPRELLGVAELDDGATLEFYALTADDVVVVAETMPIDQPSALGYLTSVVGATPLEVYLATMGPDTDPPEALLRSQARLAVDDSALATPRQLALPQGFFEDASFRAVPDAFPYTIAADCTPSVDKDLFQTYYEILGWNWKWGWTSNTPVVETAITPPSPYAWIQLCNNAEWGSGQQKGLGAVYMLNGIGFYVDPPTAVNPQHRRVVLIEASPSREFYGESCCGQAFFGGPYPQYRIAIMRGTTPW